MLYTLFYLDISMSQTHTNALSVDISVQSF